MHLQLTQEYTDLRESTRGMLMSHGRGHADPTNLHRLQSFERDTWTEWAEQGWTGLLIPEEYGGYLGEGEGLLALGVVVQEMGSALFPDPILPTSIVSAALVEAPSQSVRDKYMAALARGDVVATHLPLLPAPNEDTTIAPIRAEEVAGSLRLNGVASPVQDAKAADVLLVPVKTSTDIALVMVPANSGGVSIRSLHSMDLTRRLFEVSFSDVSLSDSEVVARGPVAEATITSIGHLRASLICAEAIGAMDAALEFTLDYAKERKAFGRSIGSFQVLKHRLADMLLWLETSKAVTLASLVSLSKREPAEEHVSVAKGYVSTHGPELLRHCLQIHGGIGFTWEHPVHLFLRRVDANALEAGSSRLHLDRLFEVLDERFPDDRSASSE